MNKIKLFRVISAAVAAGVAVLFLVPGMVTLVSQGRGGSTARSVTARVRTQRTAGNTTTYQTCQVTWRAGGTTRATDLTVSGRRPVPGDPIALRVSGDQALEASPMWLALAEIGVGGGSPWWRSGWPGVHLGRGHRRRRTRAPAAWDEGDVQRWRRRDRLRGRRILGLTRSVGLLGVPRSSRRPETNTG
jgi:hypothetical protein